jgi:pimeloyl-ACP methyl ester carboxylesterase
VLNAAGLERVHVLGWSEGGPLALLLAATHPERVLSLVLYGTQACFRREPDYPWGFTEEQRQSSSAEVARVWGELAFASASRLAATSSSRGAGRRTNARARALRRRPS